MYRGLLAIGVGVFLCVALQAQSGDGTVAGTVLDVAGKPIANAAVSVKNESTGSVRQATSDNDGRFSVTDRRPVHYRGVGTQFCDQPPHASKGWRRWNGERLHLAERRRAFPEHHGGGDGFGRR